jgi:(E)-4-hydroxy-3-methylbut-2-enyl-diphosphate synthase
MDDQGADYIYTGNKPVGFMLPNGLKAITNYAAWLKENDQLSHPLFSVTEYLAATEKHSRLNFIRVQQPELTATFCQQLEADPTAVLLLSTENEHTMAALRAFFFELQSREVHTPVIIERAYKESTTTEQVQLFASTDVGGLLLDGMGDGILLSHQLPGYQGEEELLFETSRLNQLAFGILQAARTRMSKTEYISCPSCGRTLFDLPETTAMIRKRTDHLKGVKIGIMGCIVNGPGEMADADYGYVGVGKDKIALYRGQHVVKKAVPAAQAVDELINLIREDARWVEPRIS